MVFHAVRLCKFEATAHLQCQRVIKCLPLPCAPQPATRPALSATLVNLPTARFAVHMVNSRGIYVRSCRCVALVCSVLLLTPIYRLSYAHMCARCAVSDNRCHYCMDANPQPIPDKNDKGYANVILTSVTFKNPQVGSRCGCSHVCMSSKQASACGHGGGLPLHHLTSGRAFRCQLRTS